MLLLLHVCLPDLVVSVYDDDDETQTEDADVRDITPTPQHVTSASVIRRQWTPKDSTDQQLLDLRSTFYLNSEEDGSSDDKKRISSKDKTFGSGLYPGRNARKGDGQGGVDISTKGDSDSQGKGHIMSQIIEELGDSVDLSKQACAGTGSGLETDNGNETFINESKLAEEKLSDRSEVIDVEFDAKHLYKTETPKPRSRPGSERSYLSASSAGSGHTPSIITIQQYSAPPRPKTTEKLHKPYKRKSFSYDTDKPKQKGLLARRRSSDAHRRQSCELEIQVAAPTPEPKSYYSRPFMLNNDLHWNVTEAVNVDLQDALLHQQQGDDDLEVGIASDDNKSQSALSETDNKERAEEMEAEVIDQEEYVIGNIQECNEEIKQIEAQAGDETDTNTDSGSSMDEEVIKVILGSQTEYKDEVKLEDDDQSITNDRDDINKTDKPELRRQSAFDGEQEVINDVPEENFEGDDTNVDSDADDVLTEGGLFFSTILNTVNRFLV